MEEIKNSNTLVCDLLNTTYNSKDSKGSIVSPIYKSSTFQFSSAKEGEKAFELAYHLREKEETDMDKLQEIDQYIQELQDEYDDNL